MTRATTPEEVVERISNWQAGIGPDDLAEALGWTQLELEAYHATGDLPNQASRAVNEALAEMAEDHITADLEGPVPVQTKLDDVVAHEPTLEEVNAVVRPGPLRTAPEDHEIPAYWEHYTRWRALPTGDGGWKVLGEQGQVDEELPMDRRRYEDYGPALKRAEHLNRAEVESLLRRYPPQQTKD